MEKQKKRILGLLGLVLVVIATVFAAFLPGPEAAATDVGTVTDTVVVRVVGNQPSVEILGVKNREDVVKPGLSFTFDYANVETVSLYIEYEDGGFSRTLVDEYFADYNPGIYPDIELNLLEDGYGYGKYKITAVGVGYGGVTDFDVVEFGFYPVTGEIKEDDDNGLTYLHLNYDTDNEKIDKIKIDIYDENGNLVESMSPITVKRPGKEVELPFSENNMPGGNYAIKISAYDSAGELLYGRPYVLPYYYGVVPVPDTGKLFSSLNISRIDYLVTGLLIFLSAAVLGFIFVAKNRNRRARLGKKRH